MSLPRATVRLQLHRDFTFDDAAATIDYYADLGISHFYLSPIFAARADSTHGYDVIDPGRINPELGGEEAFRRLVAQLRAAGMGVIIDIVPNHMGVASPDNRYWQHVLAWGEQSAYAHWFDIDWQHPDPRLTGKLLLPVLGEPYEDALASGVLGIRFDAASGRLALACYDALLPLSAGSYPAVLAGQHLFADTADRLASLRESAMAPAHAQLATLAATPEGRQAMARALARFAHGTPGAAAALNEVLLRQHYRLSWWRNAAEEINWRRFFEVSDLAGLCVERDDVFEATHALIFDLYRQGLVDGLRMDHVDGLADPGGYCRRVRERLTALQPQRPAGLQEDRAWIVVEKILTPGETLRQDWGVDGTTGYDFMDQAGAVLHDAAGEAALGQIWQRHGGDRAGFEAQLQAARAVKEEAYKAAHSNLNAVPKALDEEEVAFLDEHAAEEVRRVQRPHVCACTRVHLLAHTLSTHGAAIFRGGCVYVHASVRVRVSLGMQRRRDEEEAARESRDKQLYQLQLAERAAAKLASQAAAATAGLLVPTLGKRSGSGPAALASSTLPTAGVRVLPRVAVVPIAPASTTTAGSSAAASASSTGTAATGTTLDTSMSASSAPVERNDTLSAGNEESANAPASAAKRRRIDGADGQHEQGVRPSAAHVGNDLAPPASVPVSAKSVGGGSPATLSADTGTDAGGARSFPTCAALGRTPCSCCPSAP
ncbi:MAG: malto-oligosyltrehalose synthase, partial [Haliea sp.]